VAKLLHPLHRFWCWWCLAEFVPDLLGLAPAEARQLFKPRAKFQGLHGDILRINAVGQEFRFNVYRRQSKKTPARTANRGIIDP